MKLIVAAAAALAALSTGGGVALGQDGGVGTPSPPRVTDVTCMDRCAGLRAASEGSQVALTGEGLAEVTEVRFSRRDGNGRTAVQPESAAPDRVVAVVPEGTGTGHPQVADGMGRTSESPQELEIVSAAQAAPAGPFRLRQASVPAPKTYYAGKPKAQVQFMFAGQSAQDVRVDVVRRDDGQVVKSMVKPGVEPGQPVSTTWSGTTGDGRVAPNGGYKFRIAPISGGAGEDGGGATNFSYYDHKFPIRGRHSYGDGIGAGRGHRGQDVFAKCGTRLVAARAGRVQAKAYHSAAGNYVVIDGKKTSMDYVYMHLLRPASVHEGARVKTGETIGRVGETGNASGCHLHFELWSGPGWYEGGEFMPEVTRYLKKWDKWS